MWRPRLTEEWERKKSYLMRSLFEDMPVALSPVIEEQEQSSPYNRLESPLPDLIIEVEPTKPNPHDEPEEVYEQLAKKMRRLYKRDFLGIDSSSSSSEFDSPQDLRGASYDTSDETGSKSHEGEEDEFEMSKPYQADDEEVSDTQSEYSSQEDSESDFTRPVLAEEEERYGCIRLNRSLETIPESDEKQLDESMNQSHDSTGVEEESLSESLAKDTEVSNLESISQVNPDHSLAQLEIMRKGESCPPVGTPPYQSDLLPNSNVTRELAFSKQSHAQEYCKDVLTSDRELEVTEISSFNHFSFNLSSTPLKRKLDEILIKPMEDEPKRRALSIPTRPETSEKNLQTSFNSDSDSDSDFSYFLTKIGDREPTFYNICICDDHVCS